MARANDSARPRMAASRCALALGRGTSTAFLLCAALCVTSGHTAQAGTDVSACIGDCDDTNTVAIDNLLTMVNIALGTAAVSACGAGDRDQDGVIGIDEILAAVKNALDGCPVPSPRQACLIASGGAAASCVTQYVAALSACRNRADAACEAALRAPDGQLAGLLAATEGPVRDGCPAGVADTLTFGLGLDDLVLRTGEACRKWAEDFVTVTYAADLVGLPPEALACQQVVGAQLAGLLDTVAQAYGQNCYVPAAGGTPCNLFLSVVKIVGLAGAAAKQRIDDACGPAFDTLGLVPLAASATLSGRIDALMDIVVGRGRHLAQRVYPPLNLGSTGLFGPSPVGVHTLDLVDPSRLNVAGTGPRPVKVEVYYPSTLDAVAGVERETVQVLGTDLFLTPTYRDVPRALGRLPLVLFSPGTGNDPWHYVYLAAHLASHGFLVASVEHHGTHLLDTSDPNFLVNRPLDLTFLLDQLLAFNGEPGSFFADAIDAGRIGAAGHSLGGYAVMALATCPVAPGAFTDARVKAILPIDGAAGDFASQYPGIFSTITIPTLLFGGTLSYVTPLLQPAFDELTPGPPVMAYADLIEADHGTFTDTCEVPDAILEAFAGGPVPTCEPVSLPWRYARHLTNYLALNFFDATLNDNAQALARLDPAVLAGIQEVTYQSKDGCPTGQSCSAPCLLPCGDGIVGPREACDTPGEQGVCASGDVCNDNCTACVNCAGATVIDPDGGVFVGTTVGGKLGFHSGCGFDVLSPAQFFQWTPSVSHVATIQTCGGTTDFDTTLFVREGTCLGPDLACNDDAGDAVCGLPSRITLPVTAGTTYFIVVDGFLAAAGNFALSVM